MDESIRTSGRLVQGVAAALLHMHPAERRLFIRPLTTLIERVVDGDTDSISTSSTPADAAICIFDPNRVDHPRGSSLKYCGAFQDDPGATA